MFVVSPPAEVLQRIEVIPPGREFEATQMQVAGDRIVVNFVVRVKEEQPFVEKLVFSFYTRQGEKIIDYRGTPNIGGLFVCATPDELVFLSGSATGELLITRARLR